MTPADATPFSVALDALAALFGRELDAPSVELYWQACADLTLDEFGAAVSLASRTCEHFPPPAVLRRLVGAAGDHKRAADAAWPELLRLARKSSGEHSDPIARQAIAEMGGGRRLGQMRVDELESFGRRDFVARYQALAAQAVGASAGDRRLLEGVGRLALPVPEP